MKTCYCNAVVILYSLILVCNASVESGCRGIVTSSNECVLEQTAHHVLKTVGQDSHVEKNGDQHNHVDKTVDQDNHVLNSPRGHISRFIAESLNVFAPVSTTVENELCRNHSLWFQDGVINNKLWALKLFDASSKLPSGLLTGNVIDLGNYDECLSVEDVQSEFGKFSGQHCLVAIGPRSFTNEIGFVERQTFERVVREFTQYDLTAKGVDGLFSNLSMLWSVCVPSSCGPSDVEQHLRSALRTRLGNVSITIQDGACSSRANRKPLRTIDWCVIMLLSSIVGLAVLSSLYDHITRESGPRRELLLAFSLPYHWGRLMRVDLPSVEDLPIINAVKTVSMISIIFTHFAMIAPLYPTINLSTLLNQTQPGLMETVGTNTNLAVDSFLLVSGLLMCFNFLKDREKGVEFSLPRYYWHRYVRITPLFALLQLVMVTLYTAEGILEAPLLGPNAIALRSTCQDWFHTQLFVNNFLPLEKMCLGYTWYLSLDMQLFLISPLILYPLWRQPQFGKVLVFILTCVGAAISVAVAYAYKCHVSILGVYGEVGLRHYFPTYTRFTPWIIGIGAGYALHATKRVSPRLARSTVALGWTLAVTLMSTSLFTIIHFLQPGYQYDRLTSSLYLGLMRPAWALGLAWLVFALSRGFGATSMVIFFSNRIFQVLSRLSYSVYILHMPVMILFPAMAKTLVHYNAATLASRFCFDFLVSVVCGLIGHLLFEAPPIYIERIMFGKVKKTVHKEE